MKRSIAPFLLLALIIVIALFGLRIEGSLLVLQVLPLAGLALLYGYAGLLLGVGYLCVLTITLYSIGCQLTLGWWQLPIILGIPLLTAWISALRARGANIERMQRQLLEGMRDGVILSSPDGTIHLVNPAACLLLLLPESSADRLPYLREIGVFAQWETCAEEVTREYTLNNRQLQVTVTPVYEAGSLTGLVTTIVDYTAERQLTLMREDFLALVSHELRNPLTSINGFAEALLLTKKPAEFTKYAQVIKRNTDRMLRLIYDLLQMKSVEIGSFTVQPVQADLCKMVRSIIDGMSPIAAEADVHLRLDCAPAGVWGAYDADRLAQVFTNLLDNAIKHTPRGGMVTITITAEAAECVQVTVHDAGPGIPPDEIERIFDKYYQTSRGRAVGYGCGLGLAICRSLVELHGGRIWVTSTEGAGASFCVELPRSTGVAFPPLHYADDVAELLQVAETTAEYSYTSAGE